MMIWNRLMLVTENFCRESNLSQGDLLIGSLNGFGTRPKFIFANSEHSFSTWLKSIGIWLWAKALRISAIFVAFLKVASEMSPRQYAISLQLANEPSDLFSWK